MKSIVIYSVMLSVMFLTGCGTLRDRQKPVEYKDVRVLVVSSSTNDTNTLVVDDRNVRHRVYGYWGKPGESFSINECHFGEK